MRLVAVLATALLAGCAERGADDPGDFVRAEMFSHANPETVRAGCDAQGGLHLVTPPGSRVVQPEDATLPAEAIVELPQPMRGRPIRVTKSLGFIGDGKLNEAPIPHYDQPLTQPTTQYQRPYVPPTFYPRGY